MSKPNDSKMYLPVLVPLEPVFECLDRYFSTLGINYSLIVYEFLKDVFELPPGKFGKHPEGMYGAFLAQVPEDYLNQINNTTGGLAQIGGLLETANAVLLDQLTNVIPATIRENEVVFYYAQDTHVLLYIPQDPQKCTPYIRERLVPGAAIRYLGG